MTRRVLAVIYLPMLLAIGCAGLSIYCAYRRRTALQVIGCAIVVPSTVLTLFLLVNMLFGAWPVYAPYMLTLLAIAIVLAQVYPLLPKNDWNRPGTEP